MGIPAYIPSHKHLSIVANHKNVTIFCQVIPGNSQIICVAPSLIHVRQIVLEENIATPAYIHMLA